MVPVGFSSEEPAEWRPFVVLDPAIHGRHERDFAVGKSGLKLFGPLLGHIGSTEVDGGGSLQGAQVYEARVGNLRITQCQHFQAREVLQMNQSVVSDSCPFYAQ